mmetsp:Transcript_8201/g.16442  ORF Transcript_8201/g.16442 Transcript_8201/m.16442 type:complete len:213 (+) Transcript_8201:1997-2635(+)
MYRVILMHRIIGPQTNLVQNIMKLWSTRCPQLCCSIQYLLFLLPQLFYDTFQWLDLNFMPLPEPILCCHLSQQTLCVSIHISSCRPIPGNQRYILLFFLIGIVLFIIARTMTIVCVAFAVLQVLFNLILLIPILLLLLLLLLLLTISIMLPSFSHGRWSIHLIYQIPCLFQSSNRLLVSRIPTCLEHMSSFVVFFNDDILIFNPLEQFIYDC